MKVRDTSPGRLYALSSEIGCTAINGAMAADIPAGGQVVILALDKKIVIDGDDAAKFVEVRWGTNTVVGSRPVPAWLSDVLSGLISIVGDDNFDINYMPAENKLIVHTDRLSDDKLAAVTEMLERFVPQNIEVVQVNYLPMLQVVNKLRELLDAELGEEKYLLDYSAAAASLEVTTAYPNLDDAKAESVNAILSHEVPPEVRTSYGYGITPWLVDFLLYEFSWGAGEVLTVFPVEKYPTVELPVDMPEPEVLRTMTSLRGVFSRTRFVTFPDAWTFEAAEMIFEAFQSMPKLKRFPARVTFRNAQRINFSFSEDRVLEELPEGLGESFDGVSAAGIVRSCVKLARLPESLTLAGAAEITSACESCAALHEVSSGLDLSRVNGRTIHNTVNGNAALKAFYGTQLSGASACRVLNTIGTISEADREGKEFPLHIGIHIDHQFDEEVLAAISNAESKGWKLTVQWNGTPTAATASTFAMGSLIYARRDEIERADGTTEKVLDWGHYVTNWEERGYAQFRSLESAYEYFGLEQEVETEPPTEEDTENA